MDALKAEIAAKKRKAEADQSSAAASSSEPATKYLRRGEEEQLKQNAEAAKRAAQKERLAAERRERDAKRAAKAAAVTSGVKTSSPLAQASSSSAGAAAAKNAAPSAAQVAAEAALSTARGENFNISPEEAVARLRAKGEPIRLFAESDKERRLRLRALELIEERGERVGQNDFMRALAGAEGKDALAEMEKARKVERGQGGDAKEKEKEAQKEADEQAAEVREGVGMNSLLDLSLVRRDKDKVYPIIYYTLKGLLKDWENALAERPLEVRQSQQGKMMSATQVQSAEYLKPLFKSLRQRAVLPDVLMRIAEIVHYVQKREYRHANDSYLQLSIGNAPWPIGVTMVGIHERSGREKIFSSNVAHVLNDEVSRKYIQSLKRLMTFAQTKYPPDDPSMLMG